MRVQGTRLILRRKEVLLATLMISAFVMFPFVQGAVSVTFPNNFSPFWNLGNFTSAINNYIPSFFSLGNLTSWFGGNNDTLVRFSNITNYDTSYADDWNRENTTDYLGGSGSNSSIIRVGNLSDGSMRLNVSGVVVGNNSINNSGFFNYASGVFRKITSPQELSICRGQNSLDDAWKKVSCDGVCLSTDGNCSRSIQETLDANPSIKDVKFYGDFPVQGIIYYSDNTSFENGKFIITKAITGSPCPAGYGNICRAAVFKSKSVLSSDASNFTHNIRFNNIDFDGGNFSNVAAIATDQTRFISINDIQGDNFNSFSLIHSELSSDIEINNLRGNNTVGAFRCAFAQNIEVNNVNIRRGNASSDDLLDIYKCDYANFNNINSFGVKGISFYENSSHLNINNVNLIDAKYFQAVGWNTIGTGGDHINIDNVNIYVTNTTTNVFRLEKVNNVNIGKVNLFVNDTVWDALHIENMNDSYIENVNILNGKTNVIENSTNVRIGTINTKNQRIWGLYILNSDKINLDYLYSENARDSSLTIDTSLSDSSFVIGTIKSLNSKYGFTTDSDYKQIDMNLLLIDNSTTSPYLIQNSNRVDITKIVHNGTVILRNYDPSETDDFNNNNLTNYLGGGYRNASILDITNNLTYLQSFANVSANWAISNDTALNNSIGNKYNQWLTNGSFQTTNVSQWNESGQFLSPRRAGSGLIVQGNGSFGNLTAQYFDGLLKPKETKFSMSSLQVFLNGENNTEDVAGKVKTKNIGSFSYLDGFYGQSYNFTNGYVQAVNMSNATELNAENFTIFMRFKHSVNAPASNNYLIARTNTYYLRRTTSANVVQFTVYNNSGTQIVSPAISVGVDQWYSVTGVKNDTFVSIYINGELAGQTAWTGGPTRTQNVSTYLGSFDGTTSSFTYSGQIDDILYFSTALPHEEIKRLDSGEFYRLNENANYPKSGGLVQGDVYVRDNLGIGTTNPQEKLTVIGNVNISGTLNASGKIAFPSLSNCNTIDSDANGVLSCGTDEGGAGGSMPTEVNYRDNASNMFGYSTFQLLNSSAIFGDRNQTWVRSLINATAMKFNALIIGASTSDHANMTLSIVNKERLGERGVALSVVSTNNDSSAVEFTGNESARGTLKITHNKPSGVSDSSASAISIAFRGTDGSNSAAKGIFIDSQNTTGNIIQVSNDSQSPFVVEKDGGLTITTHNDYGILVQEPDGTDRFRVQPASGITWIGGKLIPTSSNIYSLGDGTHIWNNLFVKEVNVSGGLNVTGNVTFNQLRSCDTINTDANGILTCGTDADSGGGSMPSLLDYLNNVTSIFGFLDSREMNSSMIQKTNTTWVNSLIDSRVTQSFVRLLGFSEEEDAFKIANMTIAYPNLDTDSTNDQMESSAWKRANFSDSLGQRNSSIPDISNNLTFFQTKVGNVTSTSQIINDIVSTTTIQNNISNYFINSSYLNVSKQNGNLRIDLNISQTLCIALTGSSDLCDGTDSGGAGSFPDTSHYINNITAYYGLGWNSTVLTKNNASAFSVGNFLNDIVSTLTVVANITNYLGGPAVNASIIKSTNISLGQNGGMAIEIKNVTTTTTTNSTISGANFVNFNSSCSGFRFGTTGGWILSCAP